MTGVSIKCVQFNYSKKSNIIWIETLAVGHLHISAGTIEEVSIARPAEAVGSGGCIVKSNVVPVAAAIVQIPAVEIIIGNHTAGNIINAIDDDCRIMLDDGNRIMCHRRLITAADRCIKEDKKEKECGWDKKNLEQFHKCEFRV